MFVKFSVIVNALTAHNGVGNNKIKLTIVALILYSTTIQCTSVQIGDTVSYKDVTDMEILYGSRTQKIHVEGVTTYSVTRVEGTNVTYRITVDKYRILTDPKNTELEEKLKEDYTFQDIEVTVDMSQGLFTTSLGGYIEAAFLTMKYLSYFGDVDIRITPEFGMYGNVPAVKINSHFEWDVRNSPFRVVSDSVSVADMLYGVQLYRYYETKFELQGVKMESRGETVLMDSSLKIKPILRALRILTSNGDVETYVVGENIESVEAKVSGYKVKLNLVSSDNGIVSVTAEVPPELDIERVSIDGERVWVKNIASSNLVQSNFYDRYTPHETVDGSFTSGKSIESNAVYFIPFYVTKGGHEVELEFSKKVLDVEHFQPELKQIVLPRSFLPVLPLSPILSFFFVFPIIGLATLAYLMRARYKLKCPSCGTHLNSDWNVCPKCGRRVR